MSSFRILQLFENPVSKKVDVTISVDTPTGTDKRNLFFQSRHSAHHWLAREKRAWIVAKYVRYIQHKQILSGCTRYYATVQKTCAMSRCEVTLRMLMKVELLQCCNLIEQRAEDMRLILPGPENASYRTSVFELDEIIDFVREELYWKYHIPDTYERYHHQSKLFGK